MLSFAAMKKTITIIFAIFFTMCSWAQTIFSDEHFDYEIINDSIVRLIKGKNFSSKTIIIPESVNIKGKRHTINEIKSHAFLGADIDSISLPASIIQIGSNAFGNTNIKTIEIPPFLCTNLQSYIDLTDDIWIASTIRNIAICYHNPDIHYGNYPIGLTTEAISHSLELIHLTKSHSFVIAHAKPARDMPDDYLLVYNLGYMTTYNPNENNFFINQLESRKNNITIIDHIVLNDKIVVIFSANNNEEFIAGSYYFDGPTEFQLAHDRPKAKQNRLLCRHLPAQAIFTNDKSKAQLIENGKVVETLSITDFVKKYTY